MKCIKTVQYTIRGVPEHIDRALRARADAEHKSLNQVAVEALQQAVAPGTREKHADLNEFIGTWVEDAEFDRIMAGQDKIDEELWH